jgi:uncharacterized protein YhaN
MKIEKLHIKSFGKFQNKHIELFEGINLIVGDNEAGKSTIHKFIEGMFYGFYRPNIKKRMTTEEYNKYIPWNNSNEYAGTMIIDHGKKLRVERNFMKGKDALTIYNNETGEDISDSYEYDPVIKLHNFAKTHLGINNTTFKNTISISQMNSKTSDQLVKEIKDNIINLGETKNIDISVNNVLKKVQERKDAIGTIRKKTSSYGKLKQKIDSILKEKEEAIANWQVEKELKEKENTLIDKSNNLTKTKNKIEEKMTYLKASQYEKKYLEGMKVLDQIDKINDQLEGLKKYKDVDKGKINATINLSGEIQLLEKSKGQKENRLKELQDEINIIKNEINNIDIDNNDNDMLINTLTEDIYKYEGLYNNKKEIEVKLQNNNYIDQSQYDLINEKASNIKKLLFGNIVGLIILTILSILRIKYAMFGVILLAISGFILSIVYKSNNKLLHKLEKDIIEDTNKKNILQQQLEEVIQNEEAILDKHRCNDIYELKVLKENIFKKIITKEENSKQFNKLKQKEEELLNKLHSEQEELIKEENKLNSYKQKVDKIMNLLKVTTEEELKKVLEFNYEYKRINQELTSKKELFNQIVEGESINTIKEKANIKNSNIIVEESYEDLTKELKEINEEILSLTKEISTINTKIEQIELSNRKIVDIEEELESLNNEKTNMDYKIKCLDLVQEGIETISNEIQNNFAPKLNNKISSVISNVTDNKYNEIKVNPNMEISIIDNEINKLVKAEDLSAGTIDLMYFALRLKIAEIVSEENTVPFILDDCFVQYDSNRLKRIIKYLASQNRQIIIFTCHNREKIMLEEIAINVNVINL